MLPFIPWSSSVSLFVIEMMAIIHSLKFSLPFSFAVHCSHLLSLIAIRSHSLSLIFTLCHSPYHVLSLVVTRCHSLSLVVRLVVTRCTTRCHSLSFIVTRCTTLCHCLSFVVTRCTTRLSFYKRSMTPVLLFWNSLSVFLICSDAKQKIYTEEDVIWHLFLIKNQSKNHLKETR